MPSSAAPAATVRFDVLTGRENPIELREQWHALFAQRPVEPSASWEWTSAMLTHHVRRGDRVFVIRGTRGADTVALVPLVRRDVRVLGQSIALLTPLSDEYNTHSDWLLAEPSAALVDGVLDQLFTLDAQWDCFRMSRLLDDNPLRQALEAALTRRRLLHQVRRGDASYFLTLPSSYDAYLAARSGKFRNHLKRSVRKLAAFGQLQVHDLTTKSDFGAAYEHLLEVERASWKHGHGTAVTAVARQVGFYRDMGREAFVHGRLHVQWLTVAGRPVAHNFGYLHAGTYFYLKTSFDEHYKSASPATVLRARLIEGLIEQGVRQLDFPGAPYEWERQWTDTVRWHTVLSVFSGTVRSRALELIERVRHAAPRDTAVRHQDARAQKAPEAGA